MLNQTELINLILAFIEGVGLITSPCILPILPIILSGSIEGDKKRPFGVITGFILMFALFTLFSRYFVAHLGLNLDFLRNISYTLLIFFGIVMVSNVLSEKFSAYTQRLANLGFKLSDKTTSKTGFTSGLLFGALIGLIWTPCAGPILAAALVQIATQKTTLASIITLLFFALGSAVPMLLIILFSKAVVDSLSFFKKHALGFRKTLGVVVIFAAMIGLFTNNYAIPVLNTNILKPTSNIQNNYLINGVYLPYPAPPIAGINYWINSSPLDLTQLKGKVVLIDFWTYSCINCIRTLPYLIDWDKKYRDQGLVIIGVHTPEFAFEKNDADVVAAVKNDGIKYPVAMDNNYVTWNNYHNQYWPAHYLINPNGVVVYVHFGEGDYDITENNIRFLLGLNATTPVAKNTFSNEIYEIQTPETYLGYSRAENFSGTPDLQAYQTTQYTFPSVLALHHWALLGKWYVSAQSIVAVSNNAAIKIHFMGKKVFAVMGLAHGPATTIKVLLNGKPVVVGAGSSVKNSSLIVNMNNLYELLSFDKTTKGELTLIVTTPGVAFYTFTFG